jgi:uncharacterized protein
MSGQIMANRTNSNHSSGTSGTEMREAHFPGRAPIDAYGNGGFRFAGMSHAGSLICLPSGIYAWNVTAVDDLTSSAFDKVVEEHQQIEILLIGTGNVLVPISPQLRTLFSKHAMSADSMSTGAAVRTLNVLLSEGRAVAAALLAVD